MQVLYASMPGQKLQTTKISHKYNSMDSNPIRDLLNTESYVLSLSDKTASEDDPTSSRTQPDVLFFLLTLLFVF